MMLQCLMFLLNMAKMSSNEVKVCKVISVRQKHLFRVL